MKNFWKKTKDVLGCIALFTVGALASLIGFVGVIALAVLGIIIANLKWLIIAGAAIYIATLLIK